MAASGPVPTARAQGRGPTIWLAGSPDELKEWMPLGIAGIVTNTVVLNQYAKQYGSVVSLIEQYLKLTDKPVVMEIDGHCVEELLEVGQVFTNMSEQIILKIPCKRPTDSRHLASSRIKASRPSAPRCFSLTQAVAVAQAGAEPHPAFLRASQGSGRRPDQADPRMRPGVQRLGAASPSLWPPSSARWKPLMPPSATGPTKLVTMWTVYRDMMDHPLTAQWNKTFMDEWVDMHQSGLLEGVPVRSD